MTGIRRIEASKPNYMFDDHEGDYVLYGEHIAAMKVKDAFIEAFRAALNEVETILMLVEPRHHKKEYLSCLARVRASLAFVEAPAPPWEEMQFAPTDGTTFLAISKDQYAEEQVVVIKFSCEDIFNPYIWATPNNDAVFLTSEFSHWLPLPSPPTQEEES